MKTITQAQKITGIYVCINKKGSVDFTTVSCYRRDSIAKLIANWGSWESWKKAGWQCVKVDIVFKPFVPKP